MSAPSFRSGTLDRDRPGGQGGRVWPSRLGSAMPAGDDGYGAPTKPENRRARSIWDTHHRSATREMDSRVLIRSVRSRGGPQGRTVVTVRVSVHVESSGSQISTVVRVGI